MGYGGTRRYSRNKVLWETLKQKLSGQPPHTPDSGWNRKLPHTPDSGWNRKLPHTPDSGWNRKLPHIPDSGWNREQE